MLSTLCIRWKHFCHLKSARILPSLCRLYIFSTQVTSFLAEIQLEQYVPVFREQWAPAPPIPSFSLFRSQLRVAVFKLDLRYDRVLRRCNPTRAHTRAFYFPLHLQLPQRLEWPPIRATFRGFLGHQLRHRFGRYGSVSRSGCCYNVANNRLSQLSRTALNIPPLLTPPLPSLPLSAAIF
jgi:hypothetical protein